MATTSTFRDAYAARRCLVPASNYFEWTTDPERPRGKKLMWRFTVPAQEVFAFPGIWDHAETADGPLDCFTLLTSAPGPDQAHVCALSGPSESTATLLGLFSKICRHSSGGSRKDRRFAATPVTPSLVAQQVDSVAATVASV